MDQLRRLKAREVEIVSGGKDDTLLEALIKALGAIAAKQADKMSGLRQP